MSDNNSNDEKGKFKLNWIRIALTAVGIAIVVAGVVIGIYSCTNHKNTEVDDSTVNEDTIADSSNTGSENGANTGSTTQVSAAESGTDENVADEESTDAIDVDVDSEKADSDNNESTAEREILAFEDVELPESYPTYNINNENVKLVGRYYLNEGNCWCSLSGSGAEFIYCGEKLVLTFTADGARDIDGSRARVAVYIDGERVLDEMLDKKTESFTVYEGERKAIDVKIVKLSEVTSSLFAINPITVAEGDYILPAEEKPHRIEFIGDSITCGYGVDDEDRNHHFSTSTEDVTRAWAYKTAELLDADYSIFSYSGWGVYSGYTTDSQTRNADSCVPRVYDYTGFSYQQFDGGVAPQDVEWDFSAFIPDVVVINLGTNDSTYCDTPDKNEEFSEAYCDFIEKIRKRNPDAYIFCVLGTMGDAMFANIEEAVERYISETGDVKVSTIHLPNQSEAQGIAADWHPTEATHSIAARKVADKISEILGW